ERTEEVLKATEHLREQAQLLDLAHDAILSIEWDGTITFWNHGAEVMYGWSSSEAIGQSAHELLQTVFPEPLESITKKLASTERWEGELVHTRRDDTKIHVATRWALRRGAKGEPRGYLEINTDI